VAAIALAVLASFFDNFAQFPVIPPFARQLGADAALIGAVVAAYSATNLVGNLAAGYFVDRFGRKLVLVVGLILTSAAVFAHTMVQTPEQLVWIRAGHGLAAAVAAPAAFALVGDLFPRSKRGRAMGMSGALIAVAALIGPAIGGIIGDRLGYAAVFRLVAGLLLVAAVVSVGLISEPKQTTARRPTSAVHILGLFTRRSLMLAFLAALTLSFGLGILVTALPLRLADLGYGTSGSGSAFSAFALLALVVMASPVSRYGDVRGRIRPIGWGMVLCGLALGVSQQTTAYGAAVAAMALFGVGFGLLFPGMSALVADATEPGERGSAFGIFYAFYSGGVVLGALVAGQVGSVGAVGFGPFLVGGLAMVVVGVGYLLAPPARPVAEPDAGAASPLP
jgi:MFS family permease